MSRAMAIAFLLWFAGVLIEGVLIAIGQAVRDGRRNFKRLSRAIKRWWRQRRGRR